MFQQLIDQHKPDFEKAITHLHNELVAVRTGRASTALVENIAVDAYGTSSPIKNVASITVSDARTLTIQPWDKSIIGMIEKSIQSAGIGLTPMNDGNYVRLSIPPLNEERRREMVKMVKQISEAARVRVRNVREEIWRKITSGVKDKTITEDAKYEAQEKLKKMVDEYNETIRTLTEKKEQEILTV